MKAINRIDDFVAGLTLFACFVVVTAEIGGRGLFGASFLWSEELSRYLIILSTYFGASAAIRTGEHIRVEVPIARLPAGAQRVLGVLTPLACAGFCATIATVGTSWVESTVSLGLVSAESTLPVPIYWFQAAIPLCFALMAVRFLAHAVVAVVDARSPGRSSDAQVHLERF